jgi:hypothetical protein
MVNQASVMPDGTDPNLCMTIGTAGLEILEWLKEIKMSHIVQ